MVSPDSPSAGKNEAAIIAKAEENAKWISRNYGKLVERYEGLWIGVVEKSVVDSNKDLPELVARLKKRFPKRYSEASIEYVTNEPVAMVLKI